jgi:arylformamidase
VASLLARGHAYGCAGSLRRRTANHRPPAAAELPGPFKPGENLLLHTGWSRHAADAALYRDQLPRISDELAHWCVAHRVNILGVEPPSVADVNNLEEVTRIHKILLGGGVTIVEGLANLDHVTAPRVVFAALPLRLAGGDGSPVRAFAVEGVPPDEWQFAPP